MASWLGWHLDDYGGARAGRVRGLFADADSGEPAWLIAELARRLPLLRRRGSRLVAVPLRDCAGGGGRVWTAHGRDDLRRAPTVDPTRPLLREHELTICAHYGIGEAVGRAAEVRERPLGGVTAKPLV
ncbi:MAG TPA: hypothetical protein VGB06_10945 [Solirubrobacterales bacterium]|jgi:hypothetical protein